MTVPAMDTIDNTKEFKRAEAVMARLSRSRKKWRAESNRTLRRLANKRLHDQAAMFLANICVELDKTFGPGSQLTLEWMLDFYVSMEFERRARPMFIKCWNELRARKHTHKNPFDYSDLDMSAFYIPHPTKRIVVMGSWHKYGRSKALVIDDADERGKDKVIVRRIWPRSKRNDYYFEQPTLSFYRKLGFKTDGNDEPRTYGDCRDSGHVLTYDRWAFACKVASAGHHCDHVIWNIAEPLHWFSEVGWLWSALDVENER